ncbi:MAG: hypothetical protein WD602_00885 [Actinomycetota bacterium]
MLFGFNIARYGVRSDELSAQPTDAPRASPTPALLVVVLALLVVGAPSAAAVNQVERGFDLEELVRLSGAGEDPGTENLRARLDWAVEVAIPQQWRREIVVSWQIGHAGSGHLALSYKEGRSVLSPRVVEGTAESLLSTVAHEMGHQIAFQMVEPFNGFPPQEFIDRANGYFFDVKEGWSDCVSRVWTGSRHHTLSETRGCPRELAHYTATLIDDPARLRPMSKPAPPPSRPVVTPAPSPSPSPVPSPIEHPLMTDSSQPTPSPGRTAGTANAAAPESEPESFPLGLFVLTGVIAVVIIAAGRILSRVPNDRLLEWASRARPHPRGESFAKWLRKKISRDI